MISYTELARLCEISEDVMYNMVERVMDELDTDMNTELNCFEAIAVVLSIVPLDKAFDVIKELNQMSGEPFNTDELNEMIKQ